MSAKHTQAEKKQSVLAKLAQHPFVPPWWLRAGHMQTLWGARKRRHSRAPTRMRVQTPDQDFLELHLRAGDPDQPALLLLHGLEGSVASPYIAGLSNIFDEAGWSVYVMEFRSCSEEMNKARRLYHSGETTDLDFVVDFLIEQAPERPLYIAGTSLGGNVTAKWLGERSETLPAQVKAAAIISAPFNLSVSGPHIDKTLGGFYVRWFLRTLIPKAIAKEKQHPGCIDIQKVKRSKTFADFDTYATAALHGFEDAFDYWEKCSSMPLLEDIRCPTLLLSAADDPFNPRSTLPIEEAARSPFLHPLFPEQGGHVGFIAGPPWRRRFWGEEQIARFFHFYHEHG